EIVAVHSVDLVADPATTRGLFESETPDIVPLPNRSDDCINEQTAEILQLKSELDRLRAQEAVQHRRETALALIAEYHLPQPDSVDPLSKAITSERFVQTLLSAADEKAIRRLIEERAKLVHSAKQWNDLPASSNRGPMSRDQILPQAAAIADAKSFARAITS